MANEIKKGECLSKLLIPFFFIVDLYQTKIDKIVNMFSINSFIETKISPNLDSSNLKFETFQKKMDAFKKILIYENINHLNYVTFGKYFV
jgi:hypothetical protein